MTTKKIKHMRIIALTNMALRGKKLEDIELRALQMTGSKQTAKKYVDEVRKRILKASKNKQTV